MSYNTPHFTAVMIALQLNYKSGCAAVHITLKRRLVTLKVIHCIEWDYHTSPTHLLNNVCQFEVSCLTHHFSAICCSNYENCWLEWVDIQLTPKIQFDYSHHLKWSISHLASQRSNFKRHQISSSRVSRTTPHSRLFIIPCREVALLRVSSSRHHSSSIYLNKRKKCFNAF